MPEISKCPHCYRVIDQYDIDRMLLNEKKRRFYDIFYGQANTKRIEWWMKFAGISMLIGLAGVFIGASTTNDSPQLIVRAFVGGLIGTVPGFIVQNYFIWKLGKMKDKFKNDHWATFESGN